MRRGAEAVIKLFLLVTIEVVCGCDSQSETKTHERHSKCPWHSRRGALLIGMVQCVRRNEKLTQDVETVLNDRHPVHTLLCLLQNTSMNLVILCQTSICAEIYNTPQSNYFHHVGLYSQEEHVAP